MPNHWLPKSLFSRMMCIILFGLFFAQMLNRAIHFYQHLVKAEQASEIHAAKRAADMIRLISIVKPDAREAIAAQFDEENFYIKWQPDPVKIRQTGTYNNPRFKLFMSSLHNFLGETPKLMLREETPYIFSLQVLLHDNSTLTLGIHLIADDESNTSILFHIIIGQITVILFSFFAVHWATRPLENLAHAAEELGNDIRRRPLDETGPIEVIQAAHAFNRMQARLVRHIEERTQLLAAISHDLKTPITRLRLRTELLDDSDTRLRFQKDLDDMEYMVKVTLDYMRGVNQLEEFQPIDLMALLESLQTDAQEMNAQVTIEGTISTPYKGKPSALKRCISNLIDNAIKYGHSALIKLEENQDFCVIRILDAGEGIEDHQLEKVFTPYYRIETSRNRDSGGTGLGLSIAQDIAQAHGGSLVLSNSETGGLEALLSLSKNLI